VRHLRLVEGRKYDSPHGSRKEELPQGKEKGKRKSE